ncbi:sensor histidine kinase [Polyangium jinanense]|uniref:histidine kinase n=1 Tax=Polyangium jinanense TaxID=2829994 RepID=A0A9X3X5V3_9BACT|nr:GAF domain-containing sensor histidine kinase [Polyangium jinanense]MDC3954113.1 GAF domain-containing sensor histidine kinase [Polyangium jinanense]MDC3981931.1 GAF domain-containing sensor histidine kinase [Polyangium jinanense]
MLNADVEPRELPIAALRALSEEAPDVAIRSILREAVITSGFEVAIAWRLDREAFVLRWAGAWQDPDRPVAPAFEADSSRRTFGYGEGLPGFTWARGATAFVPELAAEPLFLRRAAAEPAGLRTAVAVPIHLGGEVIGVLELYDRKTRVPDAPELGVMAALEAPLALGLARISGAEERGRVDESLDLLLDAGQALGSVTELGSRLTAVASRAARWIRGFCLVHLLEAGGARLAAVDHEDPVKSALLRQPCMQKSPALDSTKSPLAHVMRSGVAQVMPEASDAMLAATIDDDEALAVLRAVTITAGMLVPIVWQGRALGALTLAASRKERRVVSTDVKVAEELARRIALAVVTDRATRDEREAAQAARAAMDRTKRLHSITRRLSLALTTAQVAEVVVEQARTEMGAHAGSVCLLDEDRGALVVARAAGYAGNIVEPFQVIPLEMRVPLTDVVRARQPIFLATVEELLTRYPILGQVEREQKSLAFAALPLIAHDRVLGAIGLSLAGTRRLDEAEQRFLESVAEHCAQALERARLYDVERRAREDNDRLYRASQAAVRAREDLLAIVSHDLRNPLVAIKLGATQIGRDAGDNARILNKTALILRSADRMDRMIRDLLDASRIETGGLALSVGREDVRAVVREAIEHFKPLATPKGIQIEESLPDEALFAQIDRERVLQVLWNLVGNAIKFTPEGGLVTLRLAREGARVRIDVADSGPGIRSDHLPHVFDRYFHAETNKASGTGLGLFIADGLVRAHGGTIHVESEPGVGTRFWFTLPLEDAA